MSAAVAELVDIPQPTRRGTSNGNDRGSSTDRRKRRAFLVECYASDIPGFTRCYRCGCLLYNPDEMTLTADGFAQPPLDIIIKHGTDVLFSKPMTVDRIIPGCKQGTYRRNNIRPACGDCNSETGGALSRHGKKK